MIRIGLWIFLALWLGTVAANAETPADDLQTILTRAETRQLSDDVYWRRLLHFRGSGQKSELAPGPFFLSPDGATDPAAEMAATIRAAFAPVGDDPNLFVTCRYPARMAFLQEALEWQLPAKPGCPDLQRWRRNGQVTGISVVFVSGDLSNPASFFGHILLKFNEADESQSDLRNLDGRSVNFGALVPEGENPVFYLTRGLIGGYPSAYSSTTYFEQRHDYGDSQQRDMWEYRLNLTPAQVARLVDHTWEAQHGRNTYFFLTRNCAYEFAQLLALAVDDLALPEIKLWSTPADLFEAMLEAKAATGAPLVADITLIASRQREFRQAYASLSRAEQRLLAALIAALANGDRGQLPDSFAQADPASQSRVLEVGLLYTRFGRQRVAADGPEFAEVQRMQRDLALLRLRLPAGAALVTQDPDIAPPTEGHLSSLAQVTLLSHSALGTGLELRLRPAYSGFLSLDAGALPYSAVSMGDVSLLVRDENINLRRLDLIRIDTFNLSRSGLPLDKSPAWSFRAGAEDRDLSCDDCLVGFVEGGYGRSFPLGQSAAVAFLAQGRAVTERTTGGTFEAGAKIQLVGSAHPGLKFAASARHLTSRGGLEAERFEGAFDIRLGDRRTSDIQIGARYLSQSDGATASELRLSASFYF